LEGIASVPSHVSLPRVDVGVGAPRPSFERGLLFSVRVGG
jgi:hypothetical protein